MSRLREALRARDPDRLRAAGGEVVAREILRLLGEEEAAEVPDLDVLFAAGAVVAQAGTPGVEPLLERWLEERGSDHAWDTAGLFLMGYWQGEGSIEERLGGRLLERLARGDLSNEAEDSLVCALGRALRRTTDANLRGAIRREFARILAQGQPDEMQPIVLTILRAALDDLRG